MTFSLRPRAVPQCSACLRSYAWSGMSESVSISKSVLCQQIRGKKYARPSGTVPVRLLKDLPGFGKRGAIIPVSTGEMRNKFFPRRVADYIPQAELKSLRANNVPMERDYTFARQVETSGTMADIVTEPQEQRTETAKPKGPEKLTPERSIQLLEIFVKPVLEFYRQPILEEKEEDPAPTPPEPKKERQRTASSAAADLLAARMQPLPSRTRSTAPQAIYGSVSLHDILVHIRAAIAINDEAARVLLAESDIRFFDREQQDEGKLKHIGDFTIEVNIKGAETGIKRTVRVKAQEA